MTSPADQRLSDCNSLKLTQREASVIDLQALTHAYCQYLREFNLAVDPIEVKKMLAYLVNEAWATIFVWHKDRRLVGFLAGCRFYSSVSTCLVFYINDMFVFPRFRGRGIARTMMASVEEWAKNANIKKLILVSGKELHPFYEALGYKPDVLSQSPMWKIIHKD